MTPAEASPGSNFVTDVATQGPTDEGLREADCRFAKSLKSTCVDCQGPIPPWALGERISLGGRSVSGFGMGAPQTYTATPGSVWQFTIHSSTPLDSVSCEAFENAFRAAMKAAGNTVIGFVCEPGSNESIATVSYKSTQTLFIGTPVNLGVSTITITKAEQLNAPEQAGLSTGAKVGIGVAVGATIAGGAVYLATHRR